MEKNSGQRYALRQPDPQAPVRPGGFPPLPQQNPRWKEAGMDRAGNLQVAAAYCRQCNESMVNVLMQDLTLVFLYVSAC